MAYIDGLVAAVPNANKDAYRKMAERSSVIFKDHGAVQLVECWGDDVPDGTLTSFPMAVKCGADETVVFAWIMWPDKSTRDAGMKQAMEDSRMQSLMETMPFDTKRLIFGGFDVIVDR